MCTKCGKECSRPYRDWGAREIGDTSEGVFKGANPNITVGVELEVYNICKYVEPTIFLNKLPRNVGFGHDGEGMEIRTQPASGIPLEQTLRYVVGELVSLKYMPSAREGLHVHIQPPTYDVKKLLNMFNLNAQIEDMLYCMVGPTRQNNPNCFKSKEHLLKFNKMGIRNFYEIMLGKSFSTNPRFHNTEYKTIEFRHHQSTTDIDDILGWVKVLRNMVEFGCSEQFDRVVLGDIKKLRGKEKFHRVLNIFEIEGKERGTIDKLLDIGLKRVGGVEGAN